KPADAAAPEVEATTGPLIVKLPPDVIEILAPSVVMPALLVKDGLPLEPPAITVPVTVPDELISRGDGENDGVAVAMVTVPVPDVPLFEAASVSTPAIEIPVGLMELPAAITTFP